MSSKDDAENQKWSEYRKPNNSQSRNQYSIGKEITLLGRLPELKGSYLFAIDQKKIANPGVSRKFTVKESVEIDLYYLYPPDKEEEEEEEYIDDWDRKPRPGLFPTHPKEGGSNEILSNGGAPSDGPGTDTPSKRPPAEDTAAPKPPELGGKWSNLE